MFVVLRSLMLIGCTVAGAVVGVMLRFHPQVHYLPNTPPPLAIVVGALAGLLLAIVALLLEQLLRRISLRDLAVIAMGFVVGAFIAWLITYTVELLPDYLKQPILVQYHAYFVTIRIALYVLFVYIGMVVAARGRTEFSLFMPRLKYGGEGDLSPLIIDTSAIIDGRIVELYKTGFLRSKILLPEFILRELQTVSDSQVPLTRAKGRRGLETLKRLQDAPDINVEVTNIDYPDSKEVDDKLMKFAKEINATILTTDYNLEQVAKIQHIHCLNIFALVNALKAPFIPGERLTLSIVKEGSEPNQGIGFLEDGTMIVVSNGKSFIGKVVQVELVSMIQGASGRIFFAEATDDTQPSGTATGERGSYDRYHRSPERRRG